MSNLLTEPVETVMKAAISEFHKEACRAGYSCTLDEAKLSIEKIAEETRRVGFRDANRIANRLMRRSDSGFGKFLNEKEVMKTISKGQLKGGLPGGGIGALIGALIGKKYGVGAYGAIAGGTIGGSIGMSLGGGRAKKDYLRSKGFYPTGMLNASVDESLAKKYLD